MGDFQVNISVVNDLCWGEFWKLVFEISFKSGSFSFTIEEPSLHSLEEWDALISGERDLDCYMGNGEGGIYVEKDSYVFIGAPSGAGGDVVSRFSIKRELISEKLSDVIADARERKLKFPDFE